jgi:membrane protein
LKLGIIVGLLILLVAVEHIYILIIEMFFSESKVAQRSFGLEKEFLKDERIKIMMANQGLYNGFLAMGLIWSIFETGVFQIQLAIFFLSCVVCAAIYGAVTVSYRILLMQGVPAILALLAIFTI